MTTGLIERNALIEEGTRKLMENTKRVLYRGTNTQINKGVTLGPMWNVAKTRSIGSHQVNATSMLLKTERQKNVTQEAIK